jgi:glycosyltransferase involved in cell wall biosynthesis
MYIKKNIDLMYFLGLRLYCDNKHVTENRFCGENGSTYIFNKNICYDANLRVVNKEKLSIFFNLDKNKSEYYYYSLLTCYKDALLTQIFESEYNKNKNNINFKQFYESLKKRKFKYGCYYSYKDFIKENIPISDENIELDMELPHKLGLCNLSYESNEFYDTPLVSIIMTIYNKEKYLKSSIESILNQTWKNIELILIDDLSTDKTKEILKLYEINPKIKIIYNDKNYGCYKSRNIGIKISNGKYITFHDADDYCLSTRIFDQINFMIKNNLMICGCDIMRTHIKNINYNNDIDILKAINEYRCNQYNHDCCEQYFGFITAMFKKEVFDKYGFYIERRKGMDMEFLERIIFYESQIKFEGDSWEFFNCDFNHVYKKLNKLLVICPQMDENNITNIIKDDEYLKYRKWRNDYINT